MPTAGSSARWQAPLGSDDFAARTKACRGWRAFARHDEPPRARVNRITTWHDSAAKVDWCAQHAPNPFAGTDQKKPSRRSLRLRFLCASITPPPTRSNLTRLADRQPATLHNPTRHANKQTGPALTDRIIGFAIEVHRTLGQGLLEAICHRCLSNCSACPSWASSGRRSAPPSSAIGKTDRAQGHPVRHPAGDRHRDDRHRPGADL